MRFVLLFVCAATVGVSLHAAENAKELSRKARRAEKTGDAAAAYLYYSTAAALAPNNKEYWTRSQALRAQALLQSKFITPADGPEVERPDEKPSFLRSITLEELEDVKRLQPPTELRGAQGKKEFDVFAEPRELYRKVAEAFDLAVVFDNDYQPGKPFRLRISEADYREVLRILNMTSGSFVVPITERLFLVAKDTVPKRQELEPMMAIAIPLPEPVSVQETQEVARAVQQAMDIQRLVVDSTRRMVLIRDKVSKIIPAQALFEQLLYKRPEVVVDVEFIEVVENSSLDYGLRLQTSFPLVWLGKLANVVSTIPTGYAFATFGGGLSTFGIGLTDAELFASMARASSRLLLRSTVRSTNGQPASLHVGEKYPIMTSGYFGAVEGTGEVFTPPPSFNFEDLGVVVKVTPYIHGDKDVTLEVESEFKVLAGDSINGIPVVASRKFQGTVRVAQGQWAVISGLLRTSEVKSITGLAGLSQLPGLGPLFRQNSTRKEFSQTLLVLKPRLVIPPPTEAVTDSVWTGAEGRPRIPI
ncbi:MAG: type II and III secretion system protein [Bryobacteraceae bacterium]|nr:type II and III secretion system protein [Bryobacteraceae bacterium]